MRAPSRPPEDKLRVAYGLFVLLGVGSLFPWNAFITAGGYFETRFCGTALAETFQNVFSLTNSGAQLLGLAGSVYLAHLASLRARILLPLALYCSVFLAMAALVFVDDRFVSHEAFAAITITGVFATAVCGALYAGGVFGLAACFPPVYTQAVMMGQGVAGVAVSLAALAALAAAPYSSDCDAAEEAGCGAVEADYSAFAYFMVSVVVMALCIGGFRVLERLPITRHFAGDVMGPVAPKQRTRTEVLQSDVAASLLDTAMDRGDFGDQDACARRAPCAVPGSAACDRSGHEDAESDGVTRSPFFESDGGSSSLLGPEGRGALLVHIEADEASACHKEGCDSSSRSLHSMKDVLHVVYLLRWPACAVWLVFTVTIAIFPSTTQHIRSVDYCTPSALRFQNQLFVPFSFLLFNVFDFLGRGLAGHAWSPRPSPVSLCQLAAARVAFVILFLFCNVDGTQLVVAFPHDVFPMLFMVLFALSNGWLAAAAMMQGPLSVPREDQELAGTVMVFFLTLGLFTGSLGSFLVYLLATGSAV